MLARGDYAPATVNRHCSAFRRMLTLAVQEHKINRHPMKGMKFLPEAHHDRFFTENHDALCAPCQECLTWGRRSGECDSSALQPQLQPRQLRRRNGAGDGDRTRTALSGHRILSSRPRRFQMSPSVANRMNTGIFRFLLPASKPFTTLPDQ